MEKIFTYLEEIDGQKVGSYFYENTPQFAPIISRRFAKDVHPNGRMEFLITLSQNIKRTRLSNFQIMTV